MYVVRPDSEKVNKFLRVCGTSEKVCRGSAIEHVMYFKCQRKYYNGSATENTDLVIFCDTCLQWDFH